MPLKDLLYCLQVFRIRTTDELPVSSLIYTVKISFPKKKTPQILDSSKLKKFADNNFKFYENDRQFSKIIVYFMGKREITCYEQFLFFPQCFQKTNVMQICKNKGLFGKGLNVFAMFETVRLQVMSLHKIIFVKKGNLT